MIRANRACSLLLSLPAAGVVSVERSALACRVPESEVASMVVNLAGKSQCITANQSLTDANNLRAVIMPASEQKPLRVSVVYVRQSTTDNSNTYMLSYHQCWLKCCPACYIFYRWQIPFLYVLYLLNGDQ